MIDVANETVSQLTVVERNEQIISLAVQKIDTMVTTSMDNEESVGNRRYCLDLVRFNIRFANRLIRLAQVSEPITEDTIKSNVEMIGEKKVAASVMDVLYPTEKSPELTSVGDNGTNSMLGVAIRKAKSMTILMPFAEDCLKNTDKYVQLAGRIFDFVQVAKIEVDKNRPLDKTNLWIGGYIGKKPPHMKMFLEGVFGKYKTVKIQRDETTHLISQTIFPDLWLVHSLEPTNTATESSHSFYLTGASRLPKGYDYQPHMAGVFESSN